MLRMPSIFYGICNASSSDSAIHIEVYSIVIGNMACTIHGVLVHLYNALIYNISYTYMTKLDH